MSSITSFFSSFISTVHNDEEEQETSAPPPAETETETEEKEEEPAAEEEEEEEPEDVNPSIREECQTTKCAKLAEHFEHCQEKVQAGEGFKGEDCVEELMMHCIDECSATKLFAALK